MEPIEEIEELDALALMRRRFRDAEEHETLNRLAAEENLIFYYGEQWADEIERQRKADGRPCFTLNKLPSIVKQVLNEERNNRLAIQISPEGDGADEDKAEALQGLARHVEENGEGAPLAYESAFEYMVIGGFASWRILTDYLPKSFNQELFIERIRNPFSVYWDPASKKLDKSDARYCLVTTDFSDEGFIEAFPDSELAGLTNFEGVGDRAPGWVSKMGVRVVEYFEIRSEEVELVQLLDGTTAYEDEIPKGARIATDENGQPISRPDTRRTAYAAKSNGIEWLGGKPKKLPTDDIPIVSIYGDELFVQGETRIKGMVQDLQQPAKLFNYNTTAISETMSLGTRSNWVATVEQIEPYQAIWKAANNRNFAVLPYKHVAGVNPPSKITSEPPIEAMSAARLQSDDDLRSIAGVYDATKSPRGGEESGLAILTRRRQAQTGNVNWSGNLARGIRRTAQILLKYFPIVYDTPRIMRILGADQQPKQVIVHAGQPAGVGPLMSSDVKGIYDLTVGTYNVSVAVGRNETKRQESVEMLLSLAQAAPMIIPIIGDLIVNEMDFAGKKAIVERMQKALPPNLQDNQNPTDPAQLQAHNSQLMQQNTTLLQHVQQLTQMVQTKAIEGQSREKVEGMKLQATQIASQAKLEAERVKAQAAILTHAADKQFDAVHDHAMATKNHIHGLMAATHAAGHARDAAADGASNARDLATHQAALAPEPAPPKGA